MIRYMRYLNRLKINLLPCCQTQLCRSKAMVNERELQNCTFVKTILMIFVVAGHALDVWTGIGS